MDFLVIGLGVVFAIISAVILAYISIATMMGPWIAPTIVLISTILFKVFRKSSNPEQTHQDQQNIILIQAIASGGGIIATGIGFALPMLYFLDPETFKQWLSQPIYFCTIISAISFVAGALGIWIGQSISHKLLVEDKLPFPVSQLTYNVMTSQAHKEQAKNLSIGIVGTGLFCALRDGFCQFRGLIPKTLTFFPGTFGNSIALSASPILVALGFTAGLAVTIPLLIGMISKYLILIPLNYHADYLPTSLSLFPVLTHEAFATAFCSGLVLSEFIIGSLRYPQIFWDTIKKSLGFFSTHVRNKTNPLRSLSPESRDNNNTRDYYDRFSQLFFRLEPIIALVSFFSLFWYFKFSLVSQLCLLLFIILATYHISIIGAKIGQVQLGRFSTFIMIPMILLFKPNFIQLTIICVFFHVCAATATDLLFDYKTGQFCDLSQKRVHRAQWVGLIAVSLCIGAILWLLFTNLQLGSGELIAQRGKSKALLIQTLSFNQYVIFFGFLYGLILKKFKISPTMTFGGIIMPNSITLCLILGGLISLVPKDKDRYLPLCSGIFASESLWILVSILLKKLC